MQSSFPRGKCLYFLDILMQRLIKTLIKAINKDYSVFLIVFNIIVKLQKHDENPEKKYTEDIPFLSYGITNGETVGFSHSSKHTNPLKLMTGSWSSRIFPVHPFPYILLIYHEYFLPFTVLWIISII